MKKMIEKNEEKSLCGDEHEFKGNPVGLGDKHPFHGKKFICELEATHKGNHSAKADDGTPIHWRRAVIV